MGWLETVSYGVVMATILAGTVFMLLAAEPDVFEEDLAWSICLTVGSLFALLGVLERPSWRRVTLAGVLILAANLDRVTTGWACVGAAVLIAVWFGFGRGGAEHRRWAIPVAGAGLVPLAVGCAVNYAKFGVLFGVSNFDQVFTQVNAYRRTFLASNHNAEAGIHFIPSTLLAYLRPDGIRFTSVFPFITLPAGPPRALGGVLFDRRYRTASLTASMPLLFLLSCWGVVTAYRPRPVGRLALARIPLLAAAIAGVALFVWGYIAPRYLADFVPFLVLASAVAMADIWRRLAGAHRPARMATAVAIGVVGLFTITANVGMALTPNEEWDQAEARHYVAVQKAVSDVTGHPIDAHVQQRQQLAPVGSGRSAVHRGDLRRTLCLQRGVLRHRSGPAVPPRHLDGGGTGAPVPAHLSHHHPRIGAAHHSHPAPRPSREQHRVGDRHPECAPGSAPDVRGQDRARAHGLRLPRPGAAGQLPSGGGGHRSGQTRDHHVRRRSAADVHLAERRCDDRRLGQLELTGAVPGPQRGRPHGIHAPPHPLSEPGRLRAHLVPSRPPPGQVPSTSARKSMMPPRSHSQATDSKGREATSSAE